MGTVKAVLHKFIHGGETEFYGQLLIESVGEMSVHAGDKVEFEILVMQWDVERINTPLSDSESSTRARVSSV